LTVAVMERSCFLRLSAEQKGQRMRADPALALQATSSQNCPLISPMQTSLPERDDRSRKRKRRSLREGSDRRLVKHKHVSTGRCHNILMKHEDGQCPIIIFLKCRVYERARTCNNISRARIYIIYIREFIHPEFISSGTLKKNGGRLVYQQDAPLASDHIR